MLEDAGLKRTYTTNATRRRDDETPFSILRGINQSGYLLEKHMRRMDESHFILFLAMIHVR